LGVATPATRAALTPMGDVRVYVMHVVLFVAYSSSRPSCDLSPVQHFRRSLSRMTTMLRCRAMLWITSQSVAPPGFCNTGEVRYGSIGGLEYEVPQSRLYCLCINVALCSTALQCICRVRRRSSMTVKAHTYCIIFGRPPMGGELPPFPPGVATDHSLAAGR